MSAGGWRGTTRLVERRSHCLSKQTNDCDSRYGGPGRLATSAGGALFSCAGALRSRVLLAFLLLLTASTAGALQPLAPPGTSSPRATFESFLALTEEAGRRLSDFRDAPNRAAQDGGTAGCVRDGMETAFCYDRSDTQPGQNVPGHAAASGMSGKLARLDIP